MRKRCKRCLYKRVVVRKEQETFRSQGPACDGKDAQ